MNVSLHKVCVGTIEKGIVKTVVTVHLIFSGVHKILKLRNIKKEQNIECTKF